MDSSLQAVRVSVDNRSDRGTAHLRQLALALNFFVLIFILHLCGVFG
jgi:hypothetical protein